MSYTLKSRIFVLLLINFSPLGQYQLWGECSFQLRKHDSNRASKMIIMYYHNYITSQLQWDKKLYCLPLIIIKEILKYFISGIESQEEMILLLSISPYVMFSLLSPSLITWTPFLFVMLVTLKEHVTSLFLKPLLFLFPFSFFLCHNSTFS